MNKEIVVGYSFSEKRVFSENELKKIAKDCGDMNFIHHDSVLAKSTRFKGIIASGSAISAIFSAMIATHFSNIRPMLGLEMAFKFPAPVRPNIEIVMMWSVRDIEQKSESNMTLYLEGVIKDKTGSILVTGSAAIILLATL